MTQPFTPTLVFQITKWYVPGSDAASTLSELGRVGAEVERESGLDPCELEHKVRAVAYGRGCRPWL